MTFWDETVELEPTIGTIGLARLTSYRTGQVVRYAGGDDGGA